jgi:hypothetical protein
MVDFNWSILTSQLISIGLSHICMFTAMCFMILILFILCQIFRRRSENYFRSIFIMFLDIHYRLYTFMALSITDRNKTITFKDIQIDRNVWFWVWSTGLMMEILFVFPVLKLIKAVTFLVV